MVAMYGLYETSASGFCGNSYFSKCGRWSKVKQRRQASLMPVLRPFWTDVGTASWTWRPWVNLKGVFFGSVGTQLSPLAMETHCSRV